MNAQKPVAAEGAPVWIDLGTHDIDGAVAFYSELFGWDFQEGNPEFGGYRMIHKDGQLIGGAMTTLMGPEGPSEEPQGPTAWSVYLRTSHAESTVQKAVDHGAQVIVPAMDISDMGKMAMVADPAGAVIGLWQPGTLDGIEQYAQAGAPCWFEAMTMDFDAAQAFYRDVFAWDMHENPTQTESAPHVRYVTHGTGQNTAAGLCEAINFMPEGTPSFWRVYFGTDDLEKTLNTLQKLGGTVQHPATDTPFGRLATVADPQGASFQIIDISDDSQ